MSHFPVDHPLRGLYRGLALLAGALLTVFGVLGYVQTSDLDFFHQDGERVLGLSTNPAFSVLSILAGLVVLAANLLGRNVDVLVNRVVGGVFLVGGLFMLCVIRTGANFLASSITNANVSFVVGLILLAAGVYGTVSRTRTRVPAPGSKADAESVRS
jgi:hypothetical protein